MSIINRSAINANVVIRSRVNGNIATMKTHRELRFMPKESFPETGSISVLYIDTNEGAIYYWDGSHYVTVAGSGSEGLIDDEAVYTTKTWSSSKLNTEFEEDQAQLDNMSYELLDNSDIDSIIS